MKYMILVKSRIGTAAAKPQNPIKTFKEARDWNQAALDSGAFDCVYGLITGRGGLAIANAASHEDLMKLLRSSPMFHYVDYEIQPLCDSTEYWNMHIETVEKALAGQ